MKSFRKVMSLILAAVMMLGTVAYANDLNGNVEKPVYDNSVVLADFSSIEKITQSNVLPGNDHFVASLDYAYGKGEAMLKVSCNVAAGKQADSGRISVPESAANWGAYTDTGAGIKVRYYIPEIADGKQVMLNIVLVSGTATNNRSFAVSKAGWGETTVGLWKNWEGISNVEEIYINVGGWSNSSNELFDSSANVYIDRMTLMGAYSYIHDDNMDDGVFLDDGYIRGPVGSWNGAHNINVERTLDNTRDGSYVAKFTTSTGTSAEYYFLQHSNASYPGGLQYYDLSDYKYVNMWVYSPASQENSVIRIQIDTLNESGSKASKSYDYKISGSGWKLFRKDISGDGLALDKVSRVSLQVKEGTTFTSGGTFSVDKFWFTNDDYVSQFDTGSTDNYVIKEFGNAASLDDNTDVVSNFTDNKFYSMNFKLPVSATTQVTRNLATDLSISSQTVKDYPRINMWMYNPKLVADSDGNPAQLNLVVNPIEGTSYDRYVINVNWVGWKLVTINASGAQAKNGGIKNIQLNSNGWTTTKWNEASYVAVDNIWMSKTAPEGSTFVKTESGIENGAESYIADNANTYTFSTKISSSAADNVKVYDKNLNKLALNTDYTVTVSDNTLTVMPKTTGTYTVVLDNVKATYPMDASGRYVNTFTLTDRDLPVINSIDKEYEARYLLPDGFNVSKLIVAEYSDKTLVQLSVEDYENGTAAVKFENVPALGNAIKFMFVDTLDRITPIYKSVEQTVTAK